MQFSHNALPNNTASIHPFSAAYPGPGHGGNKQSEVAFLRNYVLQFFLMDPEVSPGHMGYIIHSVCSGFALWSQQMDVPRASPKGNKRPNQMLELPQTDPLKSDETAALLQDLVPKAQFILPTFL